MGTKSNLTNVTILNDHYDSRNGHGIDKITIHHMAGNLSVETCGQVFQNVEASANYGIGSDGRVGCYVYEDYRAWSTTNYDNDSRAINIELANDEIGGNWHVSDTAINKCIDLCVDICKRYGISRLNYTGDTNGNLTRHNMFMATTCPGPYLESKFPYIADEVNKRLGGGPSPAPSNNVDIYYRVKTQANGWLPEVKNLNDYAGWNGSPITGVAIKVNKGSIKYRVHLKGGNWLGWVTGYNINDINNGYAGNGSSVIDCIQVYYYTPSDIRPYKKVKYKVNNYSWQYDTDTGNGQDGYAGAMGVPMTEFRAIIE